MFYRLCNPSKSNSFFLFGARGTGKTTLINALDFLKSAVRIDLLDPSEESRFALQPNLLLELADSLKRDNWIVIDEVQKVPKLLDLVHSAAEPQPKYKMKVRGSAARYQVSGFRR